MKKLFLLSALLCGAAATTLFAQGKFSIGAGLAYGFENEFAGIQLRGIYAIDEKWRTGLDAVWYLDDVEGVRVMEFNPNAHYIFRETEKSKAYALAGLNIYRVSFTDEGLGGLSFSETGINIGAGYQRAFAGRIGFLGEVKYTLSDFDQLLICAGLTYRL